MYKKVTLKNGLRVVVVPQKGTRAVTVLVLVGTGSKNETKDISGISHFLEHMFFKGTEKRPSPVKVSETLDRVGGIYNAFTGEEYTGYYAKVDSSHFDLALDVVSDIFLNSKLPPEEIRKEKGVIFEEINMHNDNPMSYVQILWTRLLYGDQPAGWDIAGTRESVGGIARKDLVDYMKSQYVASNTVVCIAGNIKTDHTIQQIKKLFANISASPFKERPKVIERQTQPEVLLSYKETGQTHLCLGARAFNLFHPQRYVQDLLAVILGASGMMSSRLFVEVREKLGAAYYVRTNSESDTDTGCLVTQAGVDNKNLEKAISTILQEYRKMAKVKVTKKELDKAKDYTKGKMALLLEASDAKASFYGAQELLEKKIMEADEIYKEIDKVTPEHILKLAKSIFQPNKLNLAMVGPHKDSRRFRKLLTI